jgi:hypothetical protein
MNRLVVLHKCNRVNLINNLSYINLDYLTSLSFDAILQSPCGVSENVVPLE